MREIPLTQGYTTIVDDDDYPALAAHRWYASTRRTVVYACRNVVLPVGRRPVTMHRVMLGAEAAGLIVHVNGNSLDNRRTNLRLSNHSEAGMRQRAQPGRGSRFKGVYRRTDADVWQVQIHIAGRNNYVGIFRDEEDAARAYDRRARKAFGEFAALNFPGPGEHSAHRQMIGEV